MVKVGLKAIYLSGWQTAADGNTAGQMYPDQSLYPVDSVPIVIRNINAALRRADEIYRMEGNKDDFDFYIPIVADAEAGFGGPLNAFELTKAMIAAGAAGIHFEDQLSSAKKCGHMGGKVLVPTREAIQKLQAARLAADTMYVPTIILARTDALSAKLITSDIDERDAPFLTGGRTDEGFYHTKGGMEQAISRGLAFAPYVEMLWFETGTPDLGQAREFSQEILGKHETQMLAYNCSPSFNWKKNLSDSEVASFQEELAGMGYNFQFITLAGFHSLNYSMHRLAKDYKENSMSAYVRLQEAEFAAAENDGYTAVRHQAEVGAGYFDEVTKVLSGENASTTALNESTEEEQF
jgi:isocitrate lyase